MKRIILVGLFIAAVAHAATERVDKTGGAYPVHFNKGVYIGPNVPNPTNSTANKVSRLLSTSATIDFTSTLVGRVESTGITLTGARVGDACMVGENATAGALKADFSCYVSAADTVKIRFMPMDTVVGSGALVSGTPSTLAVAGITASSLCTCSNQTTQTNSVKCAVATTTLTVTGPNSVTDTVTYHCDGPVDPASSVYYVYVRSSQ